MCESTLRVDCICYQKIFYFSETSLPALGPSKSPLAWVQGVIAPWLKRTGCITDYSRASNAEDKKECYCMSSHIYVIKAFITNTLISLLILTNF